MPITNYKLNITNCLGVPLLVEDVSVECVVLGLLGEGVLVLCHLCGVGHSLSGSFCHGGEFLAACEFVLGSGCGTFAVDLRVLGSGSTLEAVGGTECFADSAREVVYRVFVGYFCHNVFGIKEQGQRIKD